MLLLLLRRGLLVLLVLVLMQQWSLVAIFLHLSLTCMQKYDYVSRLVVNGQLGCVTWPHVVTRPYGCQHLEWFVDTRAHYCEASNIAATVGASVIVLSVLDSSIFVVLLIFSLITITPFALCLSVILAIRVCAGGYGEG